MLNKNMLQQAQQLQVKMAKIQEELASETVEATAGGGAVSVVATGKQHIQSITVTPEVVDPDDIEMLQDLVTAAVNEALEKSQRLATQKMGAITGGLNIPGLA
jgi:DNA-binding YbaB/EbfC family protein